MKYFTVTPSGTVEIREDSSAELPEGGTLLTDAEYDALIAGTSIVVNGQVVPA